jgi:uncharacterized protein
MFGGVFLGGIFFAIGIVLLGYCPGTSVASAGEGHRDAMIGVLGMFFGAGFFVAAYGYLEPWIKGFGNWGKITLPELTLSSPWVWIFGLSVLVLTVSTLIERMKRRFNASS